jgi:hypothetical protein
VVWDPAYNCHARAVEKVQKRFLHYLYYRTTGDYNPMISYDYLLDHFKFNKLSSRRSTISIMFIYKLIRNILDDPHSLGRINIRVPAFRGRNTAVFAVPRSRTVAHGASPLLRMMRSYNALPAGPDYPDIFLDSLNLFKNKCRKLENCLVYNFF